MNIKPAAFQYELAHSIRGAQPGGPLAEYCDWHWHLSTDEPNVPEGSIRNFQPLYAMPPVPTTAHQFVEEFMARVRIPTTDGTTRAPLPVDKVRELMVQVVSLDRLAGATLNQTAIVDKVLKETPHCYDATVTQLLYSALKFAQSSGARFIEDGPTEADYAECVAAACEAFTSALKDKGYMS